ncbi:DHH family phosphoesterase [Candidatus Woesearchaeota archaeon]|jgi:single-stranded DNA-specific DHH superfamily exonuclease|nr:DHH family phosphoesterase [Candidatus Woesearchaeota archaeon]MBT5396950.1 DHH family phosphoesterase [Candidatus Woesearchaeota archaeon]MBT5924768.1 DHH family phosphoesterase [Candidatus Woesearchaeota archaeon]MBT6367143.1 DHH family phosphoesterase [Candidatus Woesearchaeota archaeon]MBT7762283.1 DHH family phosphoesterase [Candidatus Woesearchaeota archaeon]
MLTEKQVNFIREELATAKNPLFFYDDDADGLSAFLLLYRIHREGKGVILKTSPKLDMRLFRKVEELNPDKIFVLDVPIIDQEFIDAVKRPIFWIDHHQPLQRENVHYFNPRIDNPDAYIPTTRMAWQISQREEDFWIAGIGVLGDYSMPDFMDKYRKAYPQLVQKKTTLPKTIFKQPISVLIKMFFFFLKGPTSDVRKSVSIITKIKSPDEILQQQTSKGRYLFKRFEKLNEKYMELLKQAKKCATRSKILLFNYTENQWSFTANLANELTVMYPKKAVIISRNKSGEMKCSLRAQFPISKALERALVGIEGYGGGHENACGAVIKEEDWKRFLEQFKKELS